MMNPKRLLTVLVILAIVTGGIMLVLGIQPFRPVIHAYSGLVAQTYDIEAPYYEQQAEENDGTYTEFIRPTSAEMDFDWYWQTELTDPSGLYLEVTQPQVSNYEDKTAEAWSEHVGDQNVTHSYKAQIVTCEFSAFVHTSGTGVTQVTDVTFWVKLSNNQFSAFQTADSSFVSILEIYTTKAAEVPQFHIMQVDPWAEGRTVPSKTLRTVEVPEWVQESTYDGPLSDLAEVGFAITVLKADPLDDFGRGRTESQASLYFGVDVLLFGEWVETKPWRETGVPMPTDWVSMIAWALLGVFLTLVILWRVPNRTGLIAVAVVWVIVGLGIFGIFGDVFGWIGGLLGGAG